MDKLLFKKNGKAYSFPFVFYLAVNWCPQLGQNLNVSCSNLNPQFVQNLRPVIGGGTFVDLSFIACLSMTKGGPNQKFRFETRL